MRKVVTSAGTGKLCIFLNQDFCVTSFARPCSPRGFFCGSHPSATSYSNGLTGEEESKKEEGERYGLIDGAMARIGGWVYEPARIWILRRRPSCHTSHIKNYLTMHYVGDVSRKKDECALPCGWNYNSAVRSSSTPRSLNPLWMALTQGPIDRSPPHLLTVSDCQNKWQKTSVCMDSTAALCLTFALYCCP